MSAPSHFECHLTPRYTDLDTWRHVNNSRIYQLHQEARILAQIDLLGKDAWFSDTVRLRPLRSITQYRQVSWYASDLTARLTYLGCDQHSYRVRNELYQNGELVGTQDCLIGGYENGHRVELPQATHELIQQLSGENPESLPEARYLSLLDRVEGFPVHQQLTPRYADLDADSQRSEAALARYIEQARFGGIRQLDLQGLGILIASADISFAHFQPGWPPVDLASGISHIGNTSFVFTACVRAKGEVQAAANSVMVVIDQQSGRPAPIPAQLRESLQAWHIGGV
ncbi:MAG: hypothetical protein CVV07_11200 [Gammaproteobacteria bacterium HGW-Gammaproteobacteria-11]|nr:MAG: hypothetical protein CVV07_11200 [Gammaproteobacteria bacterium HGW-Gammaproteobacteria-11]